jgi:hypothetical protein
MGVINGLVTIFSCNFSSSPNAFIGDPVFLKNVWIPAQKHRGNDAL